MAQSYSRLRFVYSHINVSFFVFTFVSVCRFVAHVNNQQCLPLLRSSAIFIVLVPQDLLHAAIFYMMMMT